MKSASLERALCVNVGGGLEGRMALEVSREHVRGEVPEKKLKRTVQEGQSTSPHFQRSIF